MTAGAPGLVQCTDWTTCASLDCVDALTYCGCLQCHDSGYLRSHPHAGGAGHALSSMHTMLSHLFMKSFPVPVRAPLALSTLEQAASNSVRKPTQVHSHKPLTHCLTRSFSCPSATLRLRTRLVNSGVGGMEACLVSAWVAPKLVRIVPPPTVPAVDWTSMECWCPVW